LVHWKQMLLPRSTTLVMLLANITIPKIENIFKNNIGWFTLITIDFVYT
jgi:hypothetical protein